MRNGTRRLVVVVAMFIVAACASAIGQQPSARSRSVYTGRSPYTQSPWLVQTTRADANPYRYSEDPRTPTAPTPPPRRNYFSGGLTGTHPNANTVGHHCVPGRGMMLMAGARGMRH
jgi:hypothetical protein